MSQLTEQFRAKGIYNLSNFYDNQPYIYYRPRSEGVGGSQRWIVCKKGEQLSAAWYDYGAKTFLVWGDKKKAFADAQAYVTEKWGITEFARDPFCGYGDATFVKSRIKEILAMPDVANIPW